MELGSSVGPRCMSGKFRNDGLESLMPIYRLFKDKAFQPEQCQAMGVAFEGVLTELGLTNRNDPLCELVATKLIELAQQGVHDAKQLHDLALLTIRTYPRQPAA